MDRIEAARRQQETRDNWSSRAAEWIQQADHMAKLTKGLNELLIAAATGCNCRPMPGSASAPRKQHICGDGGRQ